MSRTVSTEQFTQEEANLAYFTVVRRLELKNTIIRHDRIGFIYRL